MKARPVAQLSDVPGRVPRLHYEIAGILARYGGAPPDLAPTVARLFESSVFVAGLARSSQHTSMLAAESDMASTLADMEAFACAIRERLVAPVAADSLVVLRIEAGPAPVPVLHALGANHAIERRDRVIAGRTPGR